MRNRDGFTARGEHDLPAFSHCDEFVSIEEVSPSSRLLASHSFPFVRPSRVQKLGAFTPRRSSQGAVRRH